MATVNQLLQTDHRWADHLSILLSVLGFTTKDVKGINSGSRAEPGLLVDVGPFNQWIFMDVGDARLAARRKLKELIEKEGVFAIDRLLNNGVQPLATEAEIGKFIDTQAAMCDLLEHQHRKAEFNPEQFIDFQFERYEPDELKKMKPEDREAWETKVDDAQEKAFESAENVVRKNPVAYIHELSKSRPGQSLQSQKDYDLYMKVSQRFCDHAGLADAVSLAWAPDVILSRGLPPLVLLGEGDRQIGLAYEVG